MDEPTETILFCILVANLSNQRIHLGKFMGVEIAEQTLDIIYEYNLRTFKDETPDQKTRIRFDPTVTAVIPDNSVTTHQLSETSPDTRTRAESLPATGIK